MTGFSYKDLITLGLLLFLIGYVVFVSLEMRQKDKGFALRLKPAALVTGLIIVVTAGCWFYFIIEISK